MTTRAREPCWAGRRDTTSQRVLHSVSSGIDPRSELARADRIEGLPCVMKQLLDNIMWNCLSGPHAKFATGSGAVRRYAPGFSPIVGCENPAAA